MTCLTIDKYDEFVYAGTRAGEVLEIVLKTGRFTRNGPVGKIFKGGVTQINSFFSNIYVGCQNGNVSKMDKKTFLFQEEANMLGGPICSLDNSQESLYALTAKGSLHSIQGDRSHVGNSHVFMNSMSNPVVQMVFPQNYSNVFACVTKNEIRVYNTYSQAELLQIKLESDVEEFR